ncbi:uncharacterized protein [Temnothorax longispinosus]|uniref:uncharacterized protein n=1 Tax=Temnothorax longispinosus TaxID=300112 RepID=UPI003A992669
MHFATNFFHVISVSETWLHSEVSDALVALDGYFLIRHDREGRRGGGVACFIHDSLKAKIVAVSPRVDFNSPEYLIVEIRLPSDESVLFASVYRRPKGILPHEFFDTLTSASHMYRNIIIGGDLNCNLLSTNFEANCLRDLLMSSTLMNIVNTGATYHTATADSWLDVLAVDDSDKILKLTKSDSPFIAGHDLIEVRLSLGIEFDSKRSIKRRNFRDIDADKFRDCLRSIMNSPRYLERVQAITDADGGHCVDGLCSALSDATTEALDVHAPAHVIAVRRPPTRWLSDDLKTRLNTQNKMYKQAKRSDCLLDYSAYRHFRNQLNVDIKQAKSEFHFNSLVRITDSAKLWRELARLGLSPSDTRPIANLPELSKIFEKIVALQITQYLDEFDLLNPRQSAYRSGHNTQSALLRVCDDIRRAIDNGHITIMILFDFSKAFDTVPHPLLCLKLKEVGFSDEAIMWFFSYLTGRSQAVVDDVGNVSEWLFTSSGVPQGSVLGPPLFSLYINDITRALLYTYTPMLFADDVQAYLSCPPADINRGLELITRDAKAIFDYAGVNGLKLNPNKSKIIIFGSRAHIGTIDLNLLQPVVVNNTPILFFIIA